MISISLKSLVMKNESAAPAWTGAVFGDKRLKKLVSENLGFCGQKS